MIVVLKLQLNERRKGTYLNFDSLQVIGTSQAFWVVIDENKNELVDFRGRGKCAGELAV